MAMASEKPVNPSREPPSSGQPLLHVLRMEPRAGARSGSASAWTGENGLDRAASKVFATSVAATMARLQLYQNHASAEVALAAPDATKSGVDEEEAAQGYLGRASWWPFQFLALLLELLLGLFVFGRIIPRRSSLAKGAAWRSYVAAYLLISPEIALVAAAATSVRGSDYAITKRRNDHEVDVHLRLGL